MNSSEEVTLWCEACKKETNCQDRSESIKNFKKLDKGAEPITDIHWLSRARVCTVCGYEFFTVEVDNRVLSELITTRTIIRQHINIARDYKEGWFKSP